MKTVTYRRIKKLLILGLASSVFVAAGWNAAAQIVTLSHNNSTAQINTGNSAGMFNWFVDGIDPLVQQWFWFRAGAAGPEAPINAISAPTISTPDARTLYSAYNNGVYSVEVDFKLNGGSIGSGISGINESITISNSSASALSFHFYQYTDFDLGAGPNSVQLGTNLLTGLYNTADQIAPGAAFQETVLTPGANHGEASIFPTTLNKLNDANPTTLLDVNSAGPGDTTYAFQWDVIINPGSSYVIEKALSLQLQPVPEPSAPALLGLGLAVVTLLLRRRHA